MRSSGILSASIANGLMTSADFRRAWRRRSRCIIFVSGSMSNSAGHVLLLRTWWPGNLMGFHTKRLSVGVMRKNETMTIERRQHSGAFKARVALEAIRGERTVNEIAADYGVHPVQLTQWKCVALEALPDIFSSRRGAKHKEEEALKAALYQQIG